MKQRSANQQNSSIEVLTGMVIYPTIGVLFLMAKLRGRAISRFTVRGHQRRVSRALISTLLFATLVVIFAYPIVVPPANSVFYSTRSATEATQAEGVSDTLSVAHNKQDECNCSQDVELIGGITVSGDRVAATFRNPSETCSHLVGIASYKKFNEDTEDQELFEFEQRTLYPGETATLSASLPPCAAQSDAFCGEVIYSFRGGVLYGDRLLDDVYTGGPYCSNSIPTYTPVPTDTPTPSGTPTKPPVIITRTVSPSRTPANTPTITPIVTALPTQTPLPSPSATRVKGVEGAEGPAPTATPIPPPVPTVSPPDKTPILGAGDVLFGQIIGLISLAGAAILTGIRLMRKRKRGDVLRM